MADQVVKPGEQIKPQLSLTEAVKLADSLYGLSVVAAKELDGYDDKNYHLQVSEPPDNKFIEHLWPSGYVLKVMNSSDSKKLDFVEAQTEIMLHLDKHGIHTPQPQRNCFGQLYCVVQLPSNKQNKGGAQKQHVVRLLTFHEGTLLKDVPLSQHLFYEVGRYTAQLDLILETFSHPVYEKYSSLWCMESVPLVKEYLHVVDDKNKSSMIKSVLQDFENDVLLRLHSLQKGMIHGDINEHNVVCRKREHEEPGEWYVSAVLDLGDSHHSAYMLELALACTYMMLLTGALETGSHVIAGFCSLRPLPLEELKLLKVSVCARLCQSLVLGLHAHSQDPCNTYVLSSQAAGWSLLTSVWSMDPASLQAIWLQPLTTP